MSDAAAPALTIRPAGRGDVPLVLQLTRELAEYERLADACVTSEALITEALFGAQPAAEVIIAERADGTPVGFALFFHNFSTFLGRRGLYAEDLFVRPEFRGIGAGRALLAELARIARARDCGRMEWSVLDWNELAIGFYRSIGAELMDEWTTCRLDERAIAALAGANGAAAAG